MQDVSLLLRDRPGALAEFGLALADAGISVEGGGAFVHGGLGVAHFLVEDGERAADVLRAAGIEVVEVRDVVTLRLKQDVPGQLALACQMMAAAGVNIHAQYSDHDHRLILVVDRIDIAREVAARWSGSPG
jgi:hypothetical protein